jgi:stage II sporulation protein D
MPIAARRRIWLLLGLAVVIAGCGTRRLPPPTPAPPPSVSLPPSGSVRVQTASGVQTLPLEVYVAGVVAGEIGLRAPEDAPAARLIELQAILARTYALAHRGRHGRQGFDLCSGAHCQVYTPGAAEVQATLQPARRLVLIAPPAGLPIKALYHASCGGSTSAADMVWPGPGVSYLAAQPDDFCRNGRHASWTFEADRDRLRTVLNARPSTSPGGRLTGIEIIERDQAGRARLVRIHGEQSPVVSAEELRAVIGAEFGALALRSARFDAALAGRVFRFTGSGFGHGVGLCQEGARGRLRAGHSVERVLAHYYPGARLTSLD